jgi:hypothetical protein
MCIDLDNEEKNILSHIDKARQRYDWIAYEKHFRELCEYRINKRTSPKK